MGDEHADHAAGQAKEQALDEELSDQTARAGAKRRAGHDFLGSGGCPRQEQIRDVGARGGQDQTDSAKEKPQRPVHGTEHLVGQRRELHGDCPVGPGGRHVQPFLDRIELGRGGTDRHPGAHATRDVAQPPAVRPLVGHPEVGPRFRERARKD